MLQQALPGELVRISQDQTDLRIGAARRALGRNTLVLGHHYQRDDIVKWADFCGDSLKLARVAAAHPDVSHLVLCGVHFMAESAVILAADNQIVILPNLAAGCSMADMATAEQVQACWTDLATVTDVSRVLPVTYVNSTAALKAFVGRHGGAACTSSNARRVVEWALQHGDQLLFFPDQHLGRNTAAGLGLDPDTDMVVWDPYKPLGGVTAEQLRTRRILLWKGHCSVHARFTVEQIRRARQQYPGVRVIVHPECSLDVVQEADCSGSTEQIIRAIETSSPGSTWAIGTEINLVSRLAAKNPDRAIFCLDPVVCPCSTMYRVHPHYLLWVLEALARGDIVNRVTVSPQVKADARLALQRMLDTD